MMESARWDRIEALFHSAVDLPPGDQQAFLESECVDDRSLIPEVLAMIEEDARGASLLDRDVRHVAGQVLGAAIAAPVRQIGPYRIVRMLGEGGMGVVYLAERPDLGSLAAIKILRDAWVSAASRERFIVEQRTLAQFNHPSIARLYDANALADGTPWFAMEYVDGVSLTQYCSMHNCSIANRLNLVRAVCEAVQYAHEHGVVHRDIKPSNILVKEDGSVRLLDFGIAKQLESIGKPVDHALTTVRLMTPAYAAPERIRGERAGIHTDVYSLGVVLYELLAGRLPFDISRKTPAEAASIVTMEEPARPSASARQTGTRTERNTAWSDLDVLCLTAMHKDSNRRYASVDAFIRDVDHYLNDEPLEARPDSLPYTMAKFLRRNWQSVSVAGAMVALIVVAISLTLRLSAKVPPTKARVRTLAVLPFENTGNDRDVDFLRLALADEVSGTLGYARSLAIRPSSAANKYMASDRDLQKAGRELRVDNIVTGRFLNAGEQLQVTLEVLDVETNRRLWQDVFDVPAKNMVAMQAQVAAKTRRGLAPLLGVTEFVTESPPRPKNEEAYNLYLRAKATPTFMSNSEGIRNAIDLLNRSVAIDPNYAPAWEALASWYAADGWFADGGQAALDRWHALTDKITALDPDNIIFRADTFYASTVWGRGGNGGMTRGQAYRGLKDLLRQRPDSARLHFLISWMLRDTGLLDESARECEAALVVDAQDSGARSCGVTFMLRGDYPRAFDYLHLDSDSEVSKAVSIDVLLRQGKENEARQAMSAAVPEWGGYSMLLAYLQHRPAKEIAELARKLEPAPDPEVNYFSAAHLAYCGQPEAALRLLKHAIESGYCSYPAVDRDPIFQNLRGEPQFREIRTAAISCQSQFVAEREAGAK